MPEQIESQGQIQAPVEPVVEPVVETEVIPAEPVSVEEPTQAPVTPVYTEEQKRTWESEAAKREAQLHQQLFKTQMQQQIAQQQAEAEKQRQHEQRLVDAGQLDYQVAMQRDQMRNAQLQYQTQQQQQQQQIQEDARILLAAKLAKEFEIPESVLVNDPNIRNGGDMITKAVMLQNEELKKQIKLQNAPRERYDQGVMSTPKPASGKLTASSIGNMTMAEYRERQQEILQAYHEGRIIENE